MTNMQSTEQADITKGKEDAAAFLKSIEALKDIDWDRAVQDRIHSIEYSEDGSRLTVRDRAEIRELDRALTDAERDRFADAEEARLAAEEAGRRHDEWMDELTIQANAYPESDMPK